MNICVSVNSRYVRYLYVMLTSLFINNKKEQIDVYILNRDLTNKDKKVLEDLANQYKKKVNFIDVDTEIVEYFSLLPISEKMRVEIYFRLLMPYLLPDKVTRVLYLDVDTIIQGSLAELYNVDLNDKEFLAACLTVRSELDERRMKLFHRTNDAKSFNSGVMVWDLQKFRNHYCFEDFMSGAKELNYELQCHDQDILNYMFYDKVKYIDWRIFNYSLLRDFEGPASDIENAVIVHFAGINPWQIGPKTERYQIWWQYAKKTPFYIELMEEQLVRLEKAAYTNEFRKYQLTEIAEIYKKAYSLEKGVIDEKYYLAIYGAGDMAELLWEILNKCNIQNIPVAVMDREKVGFFHEIPIYKNYKWINSEKQYVFIVTPSYMVTQLVNKLISETPENVKVMSLLEFLKNIENHYL